MKPKKPEEPNWKRNSYTWFFWQESLGETEASATKYNCFLSDIHDTFINIVAERIALEELSKKNIGKETYSLTLKSPTNKIYIVDIGKVETIDIAFRGKIRK